MEEKKLSSEQKLVRVDEIFPGAGANITNLSRFSDWGRWNYDWHLDVEPMLREIAERNGPGWMPNGLIYFDKPIAARHMGRMAGVPRAVPERRPIRCRLTEAEIDAAIARGMARLERNDSG